MTHLDLTFILNNSHHYDILKAQKVMSNQLLQYLCEDGRGDAGVLAEAESQTAIPMLGFIVQHSRPPPLSWSTASNT